MLKLWLLSQVFIFLIEKISSFALDLILHQFIFQCLWCWSKDQDCIEYDTYPLYTDWAFNTANSPQYSYHPGDSKAFGDAV